MILGPDKRLYISSRFDGSVFRADADGSTEVVATDLGVTCGLAFDSDGTLYAGDRAGTIFRIGRDGTPEAFAAVPPSVAAFHLAMGPDDVLYVTAPTLASYDSVYRIDPAGTIQALSSAFGRPQGLAFDAAGSLYVAEALAGASGIYRLHADGRGDQVVAGSNLVGLAFDPTGGMVVTSNDTVYRLDVNVRGR
jgi:sugar lactone lactonase YvrE